MFDIAEFVKNFFKLPPPMHYADWIKVYTDMAVHTRKRIPTETLLCRRPNETDEVKEYRIKTYKPITYGSMNRATDELYRIVSSINVILNCDDRTKNLMNENLFGGYSFNLFLQQVVLRRMIEDPNGILVWLPSGAGLYDNAEKAIPTPTLVCSENIRYIDQDVVSYYSHEKSIVTVNKNEVMDGDVYVIVTKDFYYKLVQYGKKSNNTYKLEQIYQHNIGEIPYLVLKGDYIKPDGPDVNHGFFDSFFAPYLAFGDEAICQFSDWQAIMVTSSHPIREEFGVECMLEPAEEARANKQPTTNENGEPINESQEEYRPKRYVIKPMTKSPYNTIIRQAKKTSEDPFDTAVLDPAIPSVRFIHPDIEVARYCGESWQKMIAMAEDALHLNLGQGLLSGEAKKVDRQAQESMLLKIGNNFFDNIYYNSVVFVDAYYNYRPADRKGITIDKPANYDLKTEQDIVEEISTLKEKNAPSFFLANASIDLAKKRFSGDRLSQKIFSIVQLRDPYFIYTTEEKSQKILSGIMTKNQAIDSDLIYSILMNMSAEMSPAKFLSTDNSKLIEEFNKKVAVYYPQLATPIFDDSGNVI